MCRKAIFLAFLLSAVGAYPALADQTCFSTEDTREHVIKHGLVPLQDIVRSVRSGESSELISARLCETNGNMVYMIATLGRNGRVMRMTVDARTGNVINHR
jgi:uncharacterized membrane protein YkoI